MLHITRGIPCGVTPAPLSHSDVLRIQRVVEGEGIALVFLFPFPVCVCSTVESTGVLRQGGRTCFIVRHTLYSWQSTPFSTRRSTPMLCDIAHLCRPQTTSMLHPFSFPRHTRDPPCRSTPTLCGEAPVFCVDAHMCFTFLTFPGTSVLHPLEHTYALR